MAFNGSGVFNRIYNWVNDKANGYKITASRMDGEFDGIATGLSNCITKDGQTTISANIPFSTYKITGLGSGTARTDAINVGQVQDNQFLYLGTTSGSADAYTLAPSPAITAYTATQQFTAKINATNLTTTPYLQLSAIANPTTTAVIKKLSATKTEIAVAIGDLVANGIYTFQRNSANNAWIVLELSNPATTTTQGVAYLLPNRNILINGAMAIDQRNAGASQTITAGSALAYTVDRWYAYCTGANATGQRVAGTAPNQYNYRFTGASSITKIGFAQRIEASNSQHLAGKTATLSVDLANSLLTTITWVASYATTADSFGTIASPTKTQIATGTFTVNSTLTRYATPIAIPAGATTGIEIEFSVGSQTSGTWTIGRAQLEDTPEQTTFEYRTIQQELQLCEWYFKKTFPLTVAPANNAGLANAICHRNPSVSNNNFSENWDLNMRATPSITTYNPSSGTSGYWYTDDTGASISSDIEANLSSKRATISHLGVSGISNSEYYIHATATAEL